ncbi:SH3 domain-containing protein [Bacillus sp. FJAT-49711]|uniref:SH3 domain-containing protein n=1 Tax=Bacillus sp. FJAT-49711 TaxID=2833585 RepID=UPI001BC8F900|nr:SH3 domain-containing protein [Bacillus sp. FJAT-49711]
MDTATLDQKTLKGIALQKSTKVFSKASTSSKALKSYAAGTILKYKTYSTDWYEATVIIGGKAQKGFISKSHVESALDKQETISGVALQSPTKVYKNASTSSAIWKSYSIGSILKYKTFSSNWYEATIYIKGKAQTGYIHKSHVEEITSKQTSIKGIGIKSPTVVYSQVSTSSKKLKSYAAGTILSYKTFSSNWYEAKVYVNGKATKGFIHTDHVEGLLDKSETLSGRALTTTKIYSLASKSSKVLKSYKKSSPLKFKSLSKNWYEATVYINGKATTGYIYSGDVTTEDIINYTNYNYTFKSFVDVQNNSGAKSDGAGNIAATRAEIEYYSNPANFKQGTTEFFQFLDLKVPAGLNEKEINTKILKGKGSLEGTAKAFIDAGKLYNINDAYLIAHTLHETGNGTSTLAKGIPVDENGKVTKDSKGNIVKNANTAFTVYNMYGYGAKDSCPIDCGAKYAFDQGWITPEKAIIGGAQEVVKNYISQGQDTLYKMRWNPAKPGSHQYATHVAWATIQTARIGAIYSTINNYTLVFDVPKFSDKPKETTKPASPKPGDTANPGNTVITYPDKVYGLTNASNLNVREKPSTSTKSLGKLEEKIKIEVLAEGIGDTVNSNNKWYQIKSGKITGWVHGEYVDLLNLLEVTAKNLNVRPTPGSTTSNGMVSNEFLAGVLDKNNKIITKDEWYQVIYKGKEAWVSGGKNGTEFIKVRKK